MKHCGIDGTDRPVLITASTRQELSFLVSSAGASLRGGSGFREIYEGCIGSRLVIICVTGLGKVNAASATTALLEQITPRLIVNTGCAGAYTGCGLEVGALAVAGTELFAEEGVETSDGWQSLELIGIPVVQRDEERWFNEFPLTPEYAARAVKVAGSLGIAMLHGRFVTVSTCSGTLARGEELRRRFSGVCENMEGAAVAQVALMYGVDSLEVRGISNMVEDRDLSRWDIPGAVDQVQRFLVKFIEQL